METIQVVLDRKLLKAANIAAKQQKVNRSALIRHALQEYLTRRSRNQTGEAMMPEWALSY
jgi:metal-responsive CopG/Arc/MetJ family transcriptional regulator